MKFQEYERLGIYCHVDHVTFGPVGMNWIHSVSWHNNGNIFEGNFGHAFTEQEAINLALLKARLIFDRGYATPDKKNKTHGLRNKRKYR